jgi:hypothetical protein
METIKRKRRADRNHVIYQLTNVVNGKTYIGITACIGQARLKAVKVRWQKHVRRALTENLDWNLCKEIRHFGEESFTYEVLEVVRGKPEVHARERALISSLSPVLNTQ